MNTQVLVEKFVIYSLLKKQNGTFYTDIALVVFCCLIGASCRVMISYLHYKHRSQT